MMLPRILRRLLVGSALLAGSAPFPASAQDLALTGAVILNPGDGSAQSGVLLIEDGKITGIQAGVVVDRESLRSWD